MIFHLLEGRILFDYFRVTLISGGSKGRGVRGKIWQNRMLATPFGGLARQPRRNPKSATGDHLSWKLQQF